MNEVFLNSMKELLKDEYDAYLLKMEEERNKGFRINPLKVNETDFFNWYDIPCSKSEFARNAYRFKEDRSYGNTVYHAQGLIYIQEPSASAVADLLDVKENETVLDLCASPGGKTSQLAAALHNTGLLVANEYEHSRVNKLLGNMERWGAANVVIMNEKPENIAKVCYGFFDKILVDAPCSGEGMFRKHDEAIEGWSLAHVEACSRRQLDILNEAYKMLKQDGVLVYSTCTLNIKENEKTIETFLNEHEDMELLPIDVPWGRSGYSTSKPTQNCHRIMPMDNGDGQFMAKMIKKGSCESAHLKPLKSRTSEAFAAFLKNQMTNDFAYIYEYKDKCYAGRTPFYDFGSLKVIRQMVLCGEIIKNRFEPHHHFYMISDAEYKHSYECSEKEMQAFYKGNTISANVSKGYVALTYHHICIGFGKSDGNIIKNKLPKGLRF